jgi:succinate dehydrogenase / fumarate reductase flavoprotein subunit
LQSTIPGLFVLGEANFSDHGANRLGASALMQGLADGYFIISYTLGHYLAGMSAGGRVSTDHAEFKRVEADVAARIDRLMSVGARGKRTVESFHKELGHVMWEYCGMARNREGLSKALELIPQLREQFWADARILGERETFNQSLERAGRVADFLEFAELMCLDALEREESCGGHYRTEHQVDGEAKRDDDNFCHVAAWEYKGEGVRPVRNVEPLVFENVKLATRSYK